MCSQTRWGSKYVTIGDGGGGPIELNAGPEKYLEDIATTISFYPNPANDVLILALPNNIISITDVQIVDSSNSKIVQNYGQLTNAEQIDLCTLRKGHYILQYYCKNRPNSFKFIKQ